MNALAAEYLTPRKRLLYVLLCLSVAVASWATSKESARGPTFQSSLSQVLARHDLLLVDNSWTEIGPISDWFGQVEGLVLARERGGAADVYRVVVSRTGPTIRGIEGLTNLTRSPGAEEETLTRIGTDAAFVVRVRDEATALVVLGLAGEPRSLFSGWTLVERVQNGITNVQETGRWDGFVTRRYEMTSAQPGPLVLANVDDDVLAVEARGGRAQIRGSALLNNDLFEPAEPYRKARPAGIGWIVDTVRDLPFVGSEPIEWLQNRVFGLTDWWMRTRYGLFGEQERENLGVVQNTGSGTAPVQNLFTNAESELGWPPRPLVPVARTAAAGEGQWTEVTNDPFVSRYPNAPTAFVQTFLRADPQRPFAPVYVIEWDTRQIQLRIVSGTREPESATGERGTGIIPRNERSIRRMVAAFNGGFQSMHGEFGMMADRRIYLPPKPWAATVAVFEDGHVGIGSWPGPNWAGRFFDETMANRQIPQDMVELRQNLTSVVEDGRYNPWDRWWWGAAPLSASEQTYTTRTGLCLTEEGHMAFFWGNGMGPEALGSAMIAARCARGFHLDMNSAHCGFEFYRPYQNDTDSFGAPVTLPTVDPESQFDGPIPETDFRVLSRRGVPGMAMRFPRYLQRDSRDFFYLAMKPTLPGPALSLRGQTTQLSSSGLTHAGWPYPMARGRWEIGAGSAWVVRIDPERAWFSAERRGSESDLVVGSVQGDLTVGTHSLVRRPATVGASYEIVLGAGEVGDITLLRGNPCPGSSVAFGVDRDGFIVYVESDRPELTSDALLAAGVTNALCVPESTRLVMAPGAAPDGRTPRALEGMSIRAVRRPVSEVLFPENPPMRYDRWGYLQGQRVRYFPTQPPRFTRP